MDCQAAIELAKKRQGVEKGISKVNNQIERIKQRAELVKKLTGLMESDAESRRERQ